MARFTRVAGLIADVALGLPTKAVPYEVRRNVAVPMLDGVTLMADHYRPTGHDDPLPVVLVRLPYGKAGAFAHMFAAPLARRGFQVFIQATRGTFGSGGQFRPFTSERDDGLATIDWLRKQSWCDGRVAMAGGSYFGHTQWAVAPYADPPLTCVSPHITSANMTNRLFYEHGVPQIHTALSWSAQIGRQEQPGLLGGLPDPRVKTRVRRGLGRLPLQAVDVEAAGAPVPFWRDFVAHAEPGDDFWSQADHDGADLTRMPPVSTVTGWWDLFLAGNLADYTALRAAGNPARLVVGPWLHGEPGELRMVAQTDAVWLEHHLNGGPAPSGAPVRVHLQQANRWLDFENWPPEGVRETMLNLGFGGGLTSSLEEPEKLDRLEKLEPQTQETGKLEPQTQETGKLEPEKPETEKRKRLQAPGKDAEVSRFTYDPARPTPTVGGPLLQPPGKQADNRRVEERDDVLVFTGPVLDGDLDVVGPVSATIHVRTSIPYADVFVRLCDVDPKGVSRNVVDGIQRLDPRTAAAPGPDGIRAVHVELFPTAYRFKRGHRLRVQVAGGAFPRYARNMGTAEPFGSAVEGRSCDFEIFHGGDHASLLVVPVL
ncbi:CocE/NonD family hydrolase [Actinoplanes sp. LDG1-06]|uniref:CocE/NonD family hydrolase n=1 Tax=Paractinoplanes ovalisporus TaxID=2810368 RepID=A0ABS2A2T7_9ACTN|nr:CocE/NonD family hydrolase [Actinoplanes ovalisporus]MBM2614146.1 CocE/NonD family hydrolase [Actinoplanes ovalisporus]